MSDIDVTDVDLGWKKFVASMTEFSKHDVVIGWIDGKKPRKAKDGINNATLAAVHEFGTEDGKIPEGRLGFREWQDRNQEKIADVIEKGLKNSTIGGGNPMMELNKIGLWAVADWKRYQSEVQPGPPISEERIEQIRKRHGDEAADGHKKLVDTGQLVNGATHQVRRRVGG